LATGHEFEGINGSSHFFLLADTRFDVEQFIFEFCGDGKGKIAESEMIVFPTLLTIILKLEKFFLVSLIFVEFGNGFNLKIFVGNSFINEIR